MIFDLYDPLQLGCDDNSQVRRIRRMPRDRPRGTAGALAYRERWAPGMPVGRNALHALNAAEIRPRSDHQPSMQTRPNPLRSHEMLILLILIRSLRRRPQNFRPSRVQRIQNNPIPAMKAFLAGVAT